MKILLAPSESKRRGGDGQFDMNRLLFRELTKLRTYLLEHYNAILKKNDPRELSLIFGLKKTSEIAHYSKLNPLSHRTLKAILRYNGVVFESLDYTSLPMNAKEYIDKNTLIFSNLFGPIQSADPIPDYRFTQGALLDGIRVEKEYRESSGDLLDKYLEGEEILDLRAAHYDKFYKPSHRYTVPIFLKNGRVLSHWAKRWRGTVLREVALAGVESIEEFLSLPLYGLTLVEIRESKNRTEVVFSID